MSKIYSSIDQLIGKTPLLRLERIEKKFDLKARLVAKLEYLNPAGSAKDRVAKQMLDDAEEKGLIREGSVIIEPTSGNTASDLPALQPQEATRPSSLCPTQCLRSAASQ